MFFLPSCLYVNRIIVHVGRRVASQCSVLGEGVFCDILCIYKVSIVVAKCCRQSVGELEANALGLGLGRVFL